ncbi:MAG: (2Fe-2S)-binding protein, partial [Ktedonobacterales bacterium]
MPDHAPPIQRHIRLTVNSAVYERDIEPRATLLAVLRDELGLTGAKPGCDMGQCGACTVLVDGDAFYACLLLAVEMEDRAITTVEGLATNGELHHVQASIVAHDGLQCGFCTPGQTLAMAALLARHPHPSDEDIDRALAGNLCRCGA